MLICGGASGEYYASQVCSASQSCGSKLRLPLNGEVPGVLVLFSVLMNHQLPPAVGPEIQFILGSCYKADPSTRADLTSSQLTQRFLF